MPSTRQICSALAAALAVTQAAFGPAFSTGPTASGVYISSSTATLVVPAAPPASSNRGDLSLWVGMGTSGGDLIQSIVESYAGSAWSTYAYTLKETSRMRCHLPRGFLTSADIAKLLRKRPSMAKAPRRPRPEARLR